MEKHQNINQARTALCALACAALFLAAGCATNVGVSSSTAAIKINDGERAIDMARHDCTQDSGDLQKAQTKLDHAKMALESQKYRKAAWLAEEAVADADYARTRAAQTQEESSAQKLQESNMRLKKGLSDNNIY